jgi:predicted DNA binding CopG/RHH family protein
MRKSTKKKYGSETRPYLQTLRLSLEELKAYRAEAKKEGLPVATWLRRVGMLVCSGSHRGVR